MKQEWARAAVVTLLTAAATTPGWVTYATTQEMLARQVEQVCVPPERGACKTLKSEIPSLNKLSMIISIAIGAGAAGSLIVPLWGMTAPLARQRPKTGLHL